MSAQVILVSFMLMLDEESSPAPRFSRQDVRCSSQAGLHSSPKANPFVHQSEPRNQSDAVNHLTLALSISF